MIRIELIVQQRAAPKAALGKWPLARRSVCPQMAARDDHHERPRTPP